MAKLTDARLEKAREILDRHRQRLVDQRKFDFHAFEKELKGAWNLGYQGLKPIVMDLAKIDEYRPLAVRYMEHGTPGAPAEFKIPLAKIYGIPHYDSKDRQAKQEAYWSEVFGS